MAESNYPATPIYPRRDGWRVSEIVPRLYEVSDSGAALTPCVNRLGVGIRALNIPNLGILDPKTEILTKL